jgi:hypothetical protein
MIKMVFLFIPGHPVDTGPINLKKDENTLTRGRVNNPTLPAARKINILVGTC